MNRFFFDTYCESIEVIDDVGRDLTDTGEAQATALKMLSELTTETLTIGETRSLIVRVLNEDTGYLLLATLGLKCLAVDPSEPR